VTDRSEVCVIGAGASGALSAKVLTEAGVRVTMLEKGPWLKPSDFGSDEVANTRRHYLGPDPELSPRTIRRSETEVAHPSAFCMTPQLVGGGTVHWGGWTMRMTESDFRQHSLHGSVEGADLADWPVTYSELEPFYCKAEWALGVSGQGGANLHESFRSREYPCPPVPATRYGWRFRTACRQLGYNAFPTPMAVLTRAHGTGRPTVQNAFVELHGDPTGTRSSALTRFIPDAHATGKLDLRPLSFVQNLEVNSEGRVTRAVFIDERGRRRAIDADLFLLAAGAIESARLLLLSQSGRFPEGIGNDDGLVGRYLTLHEFASAVGVFDDGDPIFGWAGGGVAASSTYQFYESDYSRGFVGGAHLMGMGVGTHLPVNFSLPEQPRWGKTAKDNDRRYFNRSMAVAFVLSDLPQWSNRVDLDPTVVDAWGVPVPRITVHAHPNDLAQAAWMSTKAAEILTAAGASRVWKPTTEDLTGSALHQHGSLRMGAQAVSSVLDRWGRVHSTPNLYVVDSSSFPTPSGTNPTLTIMANAWRVAEHLLNRRGSSIN
jgi:choline dehydrogenase-like flavoprotein